MIHPLLVAAAIMALPPGPTASDRQTTAVLAAVVSLHNAGMRRDVAALEKLYSPEYFHTNPDGSLMRRGDVLVSYRAEPSMSFSSSEVTEQIVLVRASFAVVNERLALRGKTPEGAPFVSSYRVTYVLERVDGAWRFVNSHSSLLGIDKNPGADVSGRARRREENARRRASRGGPRPSLRLAARPELEATDHNRFSRRIALPTD